VQARARLLALAAALGLGLGLAAPAAGAPDSGWLRVEIPATGSYFYRYIPQSLDPAAPAPVVLFLHGAGGTPEAYHNYVREAAEGARVVVALPKSTTNIGWGLGQDEKTVDETLRLVSEELPVDPLRVGIAGHSAGGAYAYLLAYPRVSHYSAVFTLAASSYGVAAVADPSYKAPIRMYYGTRDENYTGGAYAALKAQWTRLGVPWEEDVQANFPHNAWPNSSMKEGFLFLARHSYPAPPAQCSPGSPGSPAPGTLCLLGGRFRAEVAWHDSAGVSGSGRVAQAAEASGLFWFFAPDNWELLVKLVDGCAVNGHFWVFSAATTDVGYELTITDTRTGGTKRFPNAPGTTAAAVTDTTAFECP